MAKIALVLGAGGLTGQAFHAGVLAGLVDGLGWDARTADLIVGTSAGATAGAYIRVGLSAADGVAVLKGAPTSPEGARIMGRLGEQGDWRTPVGPRSLPRPPRRDLLRRLATRPWEVRPETVLAVSLPPGRVPPETWTDALHGVTGPGWTDAPLWVCAVRVEDGHRVVFGRAGSPAADLATAVGASSAIPGYFRPVEIDGQRYVDGAAHSATNADLVIPERPDLVVVSSPMSVARSALSLDLRTAGRLHFRRRLATEVRRLRTAGIPVVAFQPSHDDRVAMGGDTMAEGRNAVVVDQAYATTLRRVARPEIARRLAALTG
ncbi:MAG: patatin-like phospholipase family protein [Actinomycetes bacterium]